MRIEEERIEMKRMCISIMAILLITILMISETTTASAKVINLKNNKTKTYTFDEDDIDYDNEIYFKFKLKYKAKVKIQFQCIGTNNLTGYFLYGDWMNSWDSWALYAHQSKRTEVETLRKGKRMLVCSPDYRDRSERIKKKITVKIKYKILKKYTNKLKINKSINLRVYDTRKLIVRPKPSKCAIDGNVQYGSTNYNVATVSYRGVVSAVHPGTCYVWAKTDTGKKVRCRVTVRR